MQQLKLLPATINNESSLTELLNCPQATLAISSSGGKDSTAMLDIFSQQQYACQQLCIHADLGIMEWQGTQKYIEQTCMERNIPLVTVKAKKSLFRYILERMRKRSGEVFWMSPQNRYCTSYMKQSPIYHHLRKYTIIINAVGIRADESTSRRDKSSLKLNKQLCSKHYLKLSIKEAIYLHLSKPKGRLAIDWYPLFDWDTEQVWQQLGHSTQEWKTRCQEADDEKAIAGWRYHYAYVIGSGNTRLSCCFCMIGSQRDLQNAVKYNPIAYRFITNLERKTGYSFQFKSFLSQLTSR